MKKKQISVWVNEIPRSIPEGSCLGDVKTKMKPEADILIKNGFPGDPKDIIQKGDSIVLIKKGEIPDPKELEALLAARHTPGVHKRMKDAVVGVAGLGGLGSTAAISLARMGVGRLILADYDVVEPSNLNRQQFSIKHIGRPKTEALKEIISQINPNIRVDLHKEMLDKKNIPQIFEKADIILECFDKTREKRMIMETVSEIMPEIFLIGVSGIAGYGRGNEIKSQRLGKNLIVVGDLKSASEPGRGLMAPRVGIAANLQADIAVSLLMDADKTVQSIPELE
ncbi:MAG: sulfur carrier protein ThiS adenylyltransferase ThiF [Candidatus Aminicenantes bacterium]|nr:sulfur carrier protein ThiS adenylyltransferase ThiF [Candidatus Aminicenantes bacterium]